MPTPISAGRFVRIRPAFLVLLVLALPSLLEGQTDPAPGSSGRVRPIVGIELEAGEVAQETKLHFGGWAGVVLGGRLTVAGGGMVLTDEVDLIGSEGSTGFTLNLGYGGLLVRYREPLTSRLDGEAGVVLGAGHAEVWNRLTRREEGADNFLLAETKLSVLYTVWREVQVGASIGYRLTAGVQDLPRVSAGDLNTFTASISLRVGRE